MTAASMPRRGYDFTVSNDLFPGGLYLLFEYFYNGAAAGTAISAIPSDRLETRRRHFAGLSAGIEVIFALQRFGGAEKLADAIDGSLDALAGVIGDEIAFRELLYGEVN